LPITIERLSYLTQVIEIWIFEYPLQAVYELMLNNIQSRKSTSADYMGSGEGRDYEQTEAKLLIPTESDLKSSGDLKATKF
jgi:hypothetical protein